MEAASVGQTETIERAKPRVATKKAPKKEGTPWWLWVAVAAICIFCLFPFYWLINVSLKTGPDLSSGTVYPPNPTLKNYESVLKNGDFTHALLNSAIVSLVTTFLSRLAPSFLATEIARLKLRG